MNDFNFLLQNKVDLTPLLENLDYSRALGHLRERLRSILAEMETKPQIYSALDEEAISHLVACSLNSGNLFFTASTEANCRGHVDVTVQSQQLSADEFKYLGEAKIWKGWKYAHFGLEQLDSYCTGRHQHAFMLLYFKTKTCDEIFDSTYQPGVLGVTSGVLEVSESKRRFFVTRHLVAFHAQ